MTNKTQPLFPDPPANNEEKMLAMLCHFSIFIGGIILPIIMWAIQKDKSKFVTFHALQAIFFHIAYFVAIMLLVMIMVFAIFVPLGMMGGFTGLENPQAGAGISIIMIIIMIVFYALLIAMIFGAIGYAIYVGIKTYQGELKMYPYIGPKVYKKVYGTDL